MQAACLSTLICETWVAPKLSALLCILTIYLQAQGRSGPNVFFSLQQEVVDAALTSIVAQSRAAQLQEQGPAGGIAELWPLCLPELVSRALLQVRQKYRRGSLQWSAAGRWSQSSEISQGQCHELAEILASCTLPNALCQRPISESAKFQAWFKMDDPYPASLSSVGGTGSVRVCRNSQAFLRS